jgi:hypothetical protein
MNSSVTPIEISTSFSIPRFHLDWNHRPCWTVGPSWTCLPRRWSELCQRHWRKKLYHKERSSESLVVEVGLYAGDATAEKTWLSLGIILSSDEHSQIFQNHQFRSCYVLLPIAGSMNSMTLLKIHRKITSLGS